MTAKQREIRALLIDCPKCKAAAGIRCKTFRRVHGMTGNSYLKSERSPLPHKERRLLAPEPEPTTQRGV